MAALLVLLLVLLVVVLLQADASDHRLLPPHGARVAAAPTVPSCVRLTLLQQHDAKLTKLVIVNASVGVTVKHSP
jgi:hypothetical protein